MLVTTEQSHQPPRRAETSSQLPRCLGRVTSMCPGPSWWIWSRAPWTRSGLDPSARSSGPTTLCSVRSHDPWALAPRVSFLPSPVGLTALPAQGRGGHRVSTGSPRP
uniref:Uncharacterized protein n=1 Tax=Sus scrofa TaxID=9823 RepID=A0A8D1HY13_PIG